MNDQQLKIRIKLNQVPQSPASAFVDNSEISQSNVDSEVEKPPFDWLKISIAILLLFTLIVFSYWLLTSSDKQADESLTVSSQNTNQSTDIDINQKTFELEAPQANTHSEHIRNDVVSSSENNTKPAMIIPSSKPELEGSKLHNNPQSKEKSVHVRSNYVIKAQLTLSARKQESTNSIEHIELQRGANQTVYYFLHIRNLKGEKIFVNWYYQDKPVAQIPFTINTNDWQVHASKILTKTQLGQWRVSAMDELGNILSEQSFKVGIRA